MSTAVSPRRFLDGQQAAAYERDGYLIVRGLFRADEIGQIRDTVQATADRGEPIPGWEPDLSPQAAGDPLKRYPRMMHPHRQFPVCRQALLDPRIRDVLSDLLGEEPIACQSMYYFKPPGARGQALHQDNFYLRVKPHSCIAAWTAIDPARPDNGGLHVCPGTHKMDVVCPEQADARESFTTHLVRPPAGVEPIPAELEPGDVLFFNGSVIHGSYPNASADLWRRSFICHYMPRSAREVAVHYKPLLDFQGREIDRVFVTDGGPCGTEQDAQ